MTAVFLALGLALGCLLGYRAAAANQRIETLIAADTRAAFVDDAADIAMDDAL